METTRQNKIARLLQKELSDIFLLQTKSMPGILISVSAVRISPDMSVARAYLSIFPSEKSEEIVKNINGNMKSIRFELGTRVRHQLRIIPELKFFVAASLGYVGVGMHLVRVQRFSGHGGRLFHSLRPGTENHRPRR